MQKCLWIIVFIFAANVAPGVVMADVTCPGTDTCTDYTIAFFGTGAPTTVDGSGIVLYDNSAEDFITPTIDVNWDGSLDNGGPISLNLDFGPNPLISDAFSWNCDTKIFPTSSGYDCGIFDPDSPDGSLIYNGGALAITQLTFPQDGGVGLVTFTPTPEPSTAVLWLTGIVLMILTRKRIAQPRSLPDERPAQYTWRHS